MTAAEPIRTRLLSLSAVTTLVGQRVRTLTLAQNDTYPAIRVQRISEVEPMHLRGSVAVFRSRVQVDTYATSYEVARNVDAAIHGDGAGSGLCGYSGTVGGMTLHAVLPAGCTEMYEGDEPRRVVRISRDYEVHHT